MSNGNPFNFNISDEDENSDNMALFHWLGKLEEENRTPKFCVIQSQTQYPLVKNYTFSTFSPTF